VWYVLFGKSMRNIVLARFKRWVEFNLCIHDVYVVLNCNLDM